MTNTVTGCAYNSVFPDTYAQCIKIAGGKDKIFIDGAGVADQCLDKCSPKTTEATMTACGYFKDA